MRLKLLSAALLGAALFAFSAKAENQAGDQPDLVMLNRIMDEGFLHSQLMDNLSYLTDVIGPRLTGSPALRQANDWSKEKFQQWGLENAHLEGFEFGRGWTFTKSNVRMLTPRVAQLQAIPVSWHPGTNGVISGAAVYVKIEDEKDFDEYRGKLKGKVALISEAGKPSHPDEAAFRRLDQDDLAKLKEYKIPSGKPGKMGKGEKREIFLAKFNKFLADEGAIAIVKRSRRDAALIDATGYMYQKGNTPALPAVAMTSEDYRRLLRLLDRDMPVKLELEVDAQFHDEDSKAYNTLAEIPGKGRNPEIVMAGAHLDSWFMGDGAADNGAGVAVVMEAARILAKLNVKPKRSIRFALWSGEEQSLYGSQTHVEKHYAARPEIDDPARAKLGKYYWFKDQYPVSRKDGYDKLSAYFNLDNGSGRIRGIYTEGNAAVAPIFKKWFQPFHGLGAKTVVLNKTYGTDHQFFDWVGLDAYQFIQDPLDYGSRLHHTQIDTLDHVVEDDLKQAAVIMASFLYNAAMRDDPLPRKPVPTAPEQSAAPDEDED